MKVFRSISSILLAFLTLVSSTSFMVGIHICSGEVQDVALLTKADSCEKEKSLPPCHRHTKVPCCEDETVIHSGQELKASLAQVQTATPAAIDIEPLLILISEVIPPAPNLCTKYYKYDPPLRSCDLTIEHQVFII